MTTLRTKAAATVAAVGLALFGMPAVASANPCMLPGNCSRDTQILATTSTGGLFHSFRNGTDGTWTPLANVLAQTGDPGPVVDTSAAMATGDLDVVAVTRAGGLYYTVRGWYGSWSPLTDLKAAAGNIGVVTDAAIAVAVGRVHVLVRTSTGGLYDTSWDGTAWSQFTDVTTATGSVGPIADVAATGVGGQLQILVSNSSGGLYHAVLDASGAWTRFGDVKAVTGNPGSVTRTGATKAGGELQIVVSTSTGGLYHAIRHADGTWTRIGNVKSVAGNPGAVHDVAAGAAYGYNGEGVDGQIQIAVAAGNGGLFHAIRYADGSWTTLGDVKFMAGNPGSVTRVGLSG
jgi:hypothetical protein